MQVSQGFLVVQPGALRHEAFDELQHAAGAVDKPPEDLTRIGVDGAVATFVKQPFGFRRALESKNIGVLAFEPALLRRIIACKEATSQKKHGGGQNYENDALHNNISFGV